MTAAVLLVDDERFARTVYSDHLRAAGYAVEVAETANAALELMRLQRFDLLITDVILPGADGLELLNEAKRLDPNIEALVITALDRVDLAVRAMKSGASDYLVKPVSPEALQVSTQKCLAARTLLAENKVLRSHLRLFETCQRVTCSREHGHAVGLTLEAIALETRAKGAIFLERDGAKTSLAGRTGLGTADAHTLVLTAEAAVEGLALSVGHRARTVVPLPSGEPGERAIAFPVAEGAELLGVVVALLSEELSPEAATSAEFVCSHLGLALRTLGHLKQVEHLAYLDDLTHLYNTRFLELVLGREIQGGRPFTVLFLDLDCFKAVNDEHGHLVGSELLVEVGRVLKGCVRDEDVVARYGGDEYVAVLIGIDSGGALKVAERIRGSIESHVFLSREGPQVRVTASIGLASYPEHTRNKSELLDLADRAMYRGKRSTRNVVYIASPDLPPVPTR